MKTKAAAVIEFITVFGLATASTAVLVAGLASAVGPVSANSISAEAAVPVVRLPTIVVTASAETAVDQPVVATAPVAEAAVPTYRLSPIVITGKRVNPGSTGRTAVSDKISSSNPVGGDVLRIDPAFNSGYREALALRQGDLMGEVTHRPIAWTCAPEETQTRL